MVFPWADGNLKDYWENSHPDGLPPSQSCELARWVSKQFLGLTCGLQKIHYSDSDVSKVQAQGAGDDTAMKRHGRHGDIKPENMLWFQHDDRASSNCSRGIMKLSDFGFSDFHGSTSKSRFDLEGLTPTYCSPESQAKKYVSKTDDIWSLGCVLLEFVVWSLEGWNGVEHFSQERMKDSTDIADLDDFFNFRELLSGDLTAESKPSVLKVSI
jgi:serine/threonine protein kinase